MSIRESAWLRERLAVSFIWLSGLYTSADAAVTVPPERDIYQEYMYGDMYMGGSVLWRLAGEYILGAGAKIGRAPGRGTGRGVDLGVRELGAPVIARLGRWRDVGF